MRKDEQSIDEQNKRILEDFQKLEKEKSMQIKKLIFSYARAMTDNSHRIHEVFEHH